MKQLSAEMRAKIEAFAEQNEKNIIRDIARLVAIDSVQGPEAPEAPFGEGPKKALDEGLRLARELGLDTVNCENYIGYAVVGGNGDKYLATVTHLDVVPAGDGWTGDPFTMREKEGYLIGRGVMDDKGPSVLCLYALKFLKDEGIALKYPVRALLGANEESGMADVKYYVKHYPAPLFCFSPDAYFPLINGEKGAFRGQIISAPVKGSIISIRGGAAVNAVPSSAEARIRSGAENLPFCKDITAVRTLDGWQITARGVGGHASMPENTINALGVLLDYLLENHLVSAEEEEILSLYAMAHKSTDGSSLGIAWDDGCFSPLTAVSGMMTKENDCFSASLDVRYPTGITARELVQKLTDRFGGKLRIEIASDKAPFFKGIECPEIAACMDAYNEITGEAAKPFTIGGGTYARLFPNAVAFGPEHQERPLPGFAGPIHGADEAASISFFTEALKIYIDALLRLEELDF